MNKTMQHYYTKVNEVTRIKSMPSILACAAEVRAHPVLFVRPMPQPLKPVFVQFSEIPIHPTDQDDLSKLLNAADLKELKDRVKSKAFLVPFVSPSSCGPTMSHR